MKSGKLPSDILEKKIFSSLRFKREEVLVRSQIGEDCSVLDFGEYACVLSTDPITGAANEIGKLAVHVSCNDVAANGVEPLGLMLTILAPEETSLEVLEHIVRQAAQEAALLKVEIIGGHTEITSAVNRIVVSTTAVGRAAKSKVVKSAGARPGHCIIITKWAGLEGTAIIAHDLADRLQGRIDHQKLEKARSLMEHISVVKEGVIAGSMGASAMHDVTEGGVLGALWEIAQASGVGIRVYSDRIPVLEETSLICREMDLDPLKLISSGCMLITCQDGEKMLEALTGEGIPASVIGRVTGEGMILVKDGIDMPIDPPQSDELYKVI